MDSIYAHPLYYEIAYGYRDVAAETDVMEDAKARFSESSGRRVLEVACGPAPHLTEWARRGYSYTGLDLDARMLVRAETRAAEWPGAAALVQADLASFSLPQPVDFAYVLLGSLYAPDTAALEAHFRAMAAALNPGALYLMEWCVDFEPFTDCVDTWRWEQNGAATVTTYQARHVDRIAQIVEEDITLEVNDNGRTLRLKETTRKRVMYPQEFLRFIEGHPDFAFVGWWNNWDLRQPLEEAEAIMRPLIVIRRT